MIDIKRIGKLSSHDSLAIQFITDSETIDVRIEDKEWITINANEVYIFEGLTPYTCYHIYAKTTSEEEIIAFQTMSNISVSHPITHRHAGGALNPNLRK